MVLLRDYEKPLDRSRRSVWGVVFGKCRHRQRPAAQWTWARGDVGNSDRHRSDRLLDLQNNETKRLALMVVTAPGL